MVATVTRNGPLLRPNIQSFALGRLNTLIWQNLSAPASSVPVANKKSEVNIMIREMKTDGV